MTYICAMMSPEKKEARYRRIYNQISALMKEPNDLIARMATLVAVLHHKFDYYFWTGFYIYKDEQLIVGPYQGPLACQILARNKGVCWAAFNQAKPIIVKDVHQFPDHIACDSRSNSELVVPLINSKSEIIAVLDIDSQSFAAFDEIDAKMLQEILSLIFKL
ncbi:MAG: GAF domain-containing protein [Bacteroidales bacterium]|nr:GAF domain-containing protein [Bacteroidales bacterium]